MRSKLLRAEIEHERNRKYPCSSNPSDSSGNCSIRLGMREAPPMHIHFTPRQRIGILKSRNGYLDA